MKNWHTKIETMQTKTYADNEILIELTTVTSIAGRMLVNGRWVALDADEVEAIDTKYLEEVK